MPGRYILQDVSERARHTGMPKEYTFYDYSEEVHRTGILEGHDISIYYDLRYMRIAIPLIVCNFILFEIFLFFCMANPPFLMIFNYEKNDNMEEWDLQGFFR